MRRRRVGSERLGTVVCVLLFFCCTVGDSLLGHWGWLARVLSLMICGYVHVHYTERDGADGVAGQI